MKRTLFLNIAVLLAALLICSTTAKDESESVGQRINQNKMLFQSSLGLQVGPTKITSPAPKDEPKPGYGEKIREGWKDLVAFLTQIRHEVNHIWENSPSDALFIVIGLFTFVAILTMWKLLLTAYVSKSKQEKKEDFFEGIMKPGEQSTPSDDRVYIGGRRLWRAKATKFDEIDSMSLSEEAQAQVRKPNKQEPCFQFNRKFFLASEINRFYEKIREADSLSTAGGSSSGVTARGGYYEDNEDESESLLAAQEVQIDAFDDESSKDSSTVISNQRKESNATKKKYYQATLLPKCIGEYESVYLPH